jgi:hypothetical protein
MVLETAVNGNADYLATFNLRHLLEPAAPLGIRPCRGKSGERSGANMRKSNVALRLQPSLFEEAKRVAEAEGVALNQLINVAVAEKLSALRTDDYFRERSGRADMSKVKRILKRAGRGKPPVPGDEIV